MIDQTTEGGKALQAVVKAELKKYLGQDYNDDVLPLYIVVMLAHGNQQPLVKDNLEAFLGAEKAGLFAAWLFEHLRDNLETYDPIPPLAEGEDASKQEEASLESKGPDSGQKRSREKREKIQWKGEKQDRHHVGDMEDRDEKRRRSGERGERTSRPDQDSPSRRWHSGRDVPDGYHGHEIRDRDSPRDRNRTTNYPKTGERNGYRRRNSPDQRDDNRYGRRSGRTDRYTSREDRLFSSRRLHDSNDSRDRHESYRTDDRRRDRRDDARHRSSPTREERVPLSRRLGKVPSSHQHRSPSSTPPSSPRQPAKASVFDRLKKLDPEDLKANTSRREKQHSSLDAAIKSRMRMDTLPTSKAGPPLSDSPASHESEADVTPAPTVQAAPSSTAGQDDVAAELRQIKEQLAAMNAKRAEKKQTEMATQSARMVVVQNVHFNATSEILKAHFSGCGRLVSAVIEKEASGRPKGVAVLEFDAEEGKQTALSLSGSLLLGRPITVLAKEAPRSWPSNGFGHTETGPTFRPRAPSFQRGRGRASFPGRHTLKNNKYVRPAQEVSNGENTTA